MAVCAAAPQVEAREMLHPRCALLRAAARHAELPGAQGQAGCRRWGGQLQGANIQACSCSTC